LIRRSTSLPLIFGRFQSSRMRSGNGAFVRSSSNSIFQGVLAILCDHNIPPDFAAIPKSSLDEVQVWFTVLYYKKKNSLRNCWSV
jgi:hypothetical protein